MDERSRQREFEERFLSQLRARALALVPGKLPAEDVEFQPTPEGIDAVRAELGRLEVYERDTVDTLPGTRSQRMVFRKKYLGGLIRPIVSRVQARVISQVDAAAE